MRVVSHEKFVRKVYDKFGDKYTVIGEYQGKQNKVLIKHNLCGYEWEVTPQNLFAMQSKCPFCSNRIKYTAETFQDKMDEVANGEYLLVSEFLSMKKYIRIKHLVCDHEWSLLPHSFLHSKSRCPNCAGLAKYDTERFINKVKELTGEQYIVLGESYNQKTEVLMKHVDCDQDFLMTPMRFVNYGSRCPYCFPSEFESQGELLIEYFLDKNNIKYIKQYSFADCKNINALSFDFAIFDKNDNLILLIEFDGKQHYEPIDFFGGEKSFKEQIKRDKIKNDYCIKNNIPLIRIPYWDFNNIEIIVEMELRNYNLLNIK